MIQKDGITCIQTHTYINMIYDIFRMEQFRRAQHGLSKFCTVTQPVPFNPPSVSPGCNVLPAPTVSDALFCYTIKLQALNTHSDYRGPKGEGCYILCVGLYKHPH